MKPYDDAKLAQYIRQEITEKQLLGKQIDGVFEIGDEVKLIENYQGIQKGTVGIVRTTLKGESLIGIQVEGWAGHTLQNEIEEENGWWVHKECLTHI